MIPLTALRAVPWKLVGIGLLAMTAALGWWRADVWHRRFDDLTAEVGTIVVAIRDASDNPTVTVDTAAAQVQAMGESRRQVQARIEEINAAVAVIADETQRLKAKRQMLEREAARAIAQRDAARKRLADATAAPAVKRDCKQLVDEAGELLDLIRKEGF